MLIMTKRRLNELLNRVDADIRLNVSKALATAMEAVEAVEAAKEERPTLGALSEKVYDNAREKGFWEGDGSPVAAHLALVHMLLSRAMEADRKGEGREEVERALLLAGEGVLLLLEGYVAKLGAEEQSALTKLALTHSEASEAAEAVLRDDTEAFGEELADVVIRCLDLAEGYGLGMEEEVLSKMEKNAGREHMHGGKKY